MPHSLNDFDGAAKTLIDVVKHRGGSDNLTVVSLFFIIFENDFRQIVLGLQYEKIER